MKKLEGIILHTQPHHHQTKPVRNRCLQTPFSSKSQHIFGELVEKESTITQKPNRQIFSS